MRNEIWGGLLRKRGWAQPTPPAPLLTATLLSPSLSASPSPPRNQLIAINIKTGKKKWGYKPMFSPLSIKKKQNQNPPPPEPKKKKNKSKPKKPS